MNNQNQKEFKKISLDFLEELRASMDDKPQFSVDKNFNQGRQFKDNANIIVEKYQQKQQTQQYNNQSNNYNMNGKIGLKIPLSQNRENEMRASNNQLDLDDMDDLDQMVDDILGNGTGIEQPIKNKNNSYNIRSINKQLESPQINKTPPNSKKTITNTPGSMRHNSKMDSINFAIMNNSINQAKIIDYMGVSVKRQIDNQYHPRTIQNSPSNRLDQPKLKTPKASGGMNKTHQLDDEEFEKLIQESVDKRQQKNSYLLRKITGNQPSTPSKQNTNGFNLDDLLNELNGTDKKIDPRQNKAVYFNQESIQVYHQNSNANRFDTNKRLSQAGLDDMLLNQNENNGNLLEVLRSDSLSNYLKDIKNKYLSRPQLNQDGMLSLFQQRSLQIRKPFDIYCDKDSKPGLVKLKCDIKGLPNDGRLVAVSNFSQQASVFNGYNRVGYNQGESIIIVSASVDNTYMLFGFKETPMTLQRAIDSVDVFAIESTTIKPKFEIYPPGVRLYRLREWDDLGIDLAILDNGGNMDMLRFNSFIQFEPGEIAILSEMYLVVKSFNPDNREPLLSNDKVRILSLREGDLVLMTVLPNKSGWFEGYKATDSDRLCGIGHKNFLKKINFK
eukprot:403367623